MNPKILLAALAAIVLLPTAASAKYCGMTAAKRHGLPYVYNGMNLKMARTWYQFPRTICHPGAVMVPHAHHVATIEACNGDGTAQVSDETGTYTRRIAGAIVEPPNVGYAQTYSAAPRQRHSRGRHRHRVAYYDNNDSQNWRDVH